MKRLACPSFLVPLCLLLLSPSLAIAAESPISASITNKLADLQTALSQAQKTYEDASAALPENAEGEKKSNELWRRFDQTQSELFSSAVDLAKRDPKSDIAFAALEWVLTTPRSYYLPSGLPAMVLTRTHHAMNPKIGKIIAWVGYYIPREGVIAACSTRAHQCGRQHEPGSHGARPGGHCSRLAGQRKI